MTGEGPVRFWGEERWEGRLEGRWEGGLVWFGVGK